MTDSTQSPIWRTHPIHSHVEVSDLGQVRTIAYVGDGLAGRLGWHYRMRLRRQTINSDGYATVQIDNIMMKTHALVLETFVGPCPDGMEVLHRDADRANPRLSNLHYGTRSENQLQRVTDGNHHLANRTRCPRGHQLVAPNLRAEGIKHGKRQCLACERGLQWARRHPGADLQSACDRYYVLNE